MTWWFCLSLAYFVLLQCQARSACCLFIFIFAVLMPVVSLPIWAVRWRLRHSSSYFPLANFHVYYECLQGSVALKFDSLFEWVLHQLAKETHASCKVKKMHF